LEKDGWKITYDPFPLEIGEKTLSADLGAEHLISAEKGLKKNRFTKAQIPSYRI